MGEKVVGAVSLFEIPARQKCARCLLILWFDSGDLCLCCKFALTFVTFFVPSVREAGEYQVHVVLGTKWLRITKVSLEQLWFALAMAKIEFTNAPVGCGGEVCRRGPPSPRF